MVRRRSIVWQHFSEILIGKYKGGACKYCSKQFITNASRMGKHLTNCEKAPVIVKHFFSETDAIKKEDYSFDEIPSTSLNDFHDSLPCDPDVS